MRLVQLAKERNIAYNPTHEAATALHAYCLRKGIPAPEGIGGPDGPVPIYAPQPQMTDFAAIDNPPMNNMPPGGGDGGNFSGGGAPVYNGGQPPAYNAGPSAYPDANQPPAFNAGQPAYAPIEPPQMPQ